MDSTTTQVQATDSLIIEVNWSRGDIGVATCTGRPAPGSRINAGAVENALEHVHSCSDVTLSTKVGMSYLICEVPLPTDDDENLVEAHVLSIFECMIAGIEDHLATTGEEFISSTMSMRDRDLELVNSTSD